MQKIRYGIQGGIGSFNEEALNYYLKKNKIKDFEISYLYTTEKVLKAVSKNESDYGQFAIENSVGGLVDESIKAMANYIFEIVEEFYIPITHHLMKKKGVDAEKIDTIMAHPQALKQCKDNLTTKYPDFKKISGKGDLLDTAKAAEALSQGMLPENTAILGPHCLTEIFDFEIIEKDLQDDQTNNTSFLLVKNKV